MVERLAFYIIFKFIEGMIGERQTKTPPFSNNTFNFINNICLFFPDGYFQDFFWPDTFVIRRLFFIITSKSTFCQPAATLDINKPFNKGEFFTSRSSRRIQSFLFFKRRHPFSESVSSGRMLTVNSWMTQRFKNHRGNYALLKR